MLTAQAIEEETSLDTIESSTLDTPNSDDNALLWHLFDMAPSDQQYKDQIPPLGHHRGQRGFMGYHASIEVSEEYADNVNAILDADSDIQNLFSEGYNVTSINPIIKNLIEADGTLVTKADIAEVRLQNGDSGYANATVDVEEAVVTKIVIITRTIIDKTTA